MPKHSKKKRSTKSDGRMHYSKREMLSVDDGARTSNSSSSSSSSSSSESYTESGGSDCSSSSSSSSSSGHYGGKRSQKHRRNRRGKKGYGSGNQKADEKQAPKVPVFSSGKKRVTPSAGSSDKIQVVKAIDSAEHDSLNWGKTTLMIKVEGSLNDIASQAGTDKYGNEMPLQISLGQCVRVESTTDDIHERIQKNRGLKIATKEQMASNPAVIADHRDVVRRVVVSGHNKFPGAIEIKLDNLQGSASNVQYSSANATSGQKDTQSLVIRAESGEKIDSRTMLRNDLTEEDLYHMKYYSKATERNLDEGVVAARDRNGVAQVSVECSADKPHVVIDEICRFFKNDERCTDAMRKHIEKTGEIPSEVIHISSDYPGCVIVPKDVFEDYKQRCIVGLKKNRPLSDISHPYGTFTRVLTEDHFKSAEDRVKSSSAMDQSGKTVWTNAEGTDIGVIHEQAKRHAFTKCNSAYFRVDVYHAPIDQIAAENED